MNYIILDLEWNQPLSASSCIRSPFLLSGEIIEIGAVKLDSAFQKFGEFRSYVKPVFYTSLNPTIARLTKIGNSNIRNAPIFPEAYQAFLSWAGSEFSFLTWGPDDLPMLFDNMLYHDVSVPSGIPVYDLQRVFGYEIMRDNRQCSLEKAMEITGEKPERAHDALNDCVNTAKVCTHINLSECLPAYRSSFFCYEADRRYFSAKTYSERNAFLSDESVFSFECPYCGKKAFCEGWARVPGGNLISSALCEENDEFYVQLLIARQNAEYSIQRMIMDMNDDYWDTYSERLELSPVNPT